MKIACPTVRCVTVPRSGRFRFICYVAIEKMNEGEAKLAAMAAFVADPFLKFVIVVDHDVDINNDTDVLHAIATRVRADHDIFMVPYAKGSPLDPASYDPARRLAPCHQNGHRRHPQEQLPGRDQRARL